jgi:hypothetical protein
VVLRRIRQAHPGGRELPNRMNSSLRMPDKGYASGTGHKEGVMTTNRGPYPAQYPVQFAVEYPDRPLNRLTSFFRIFVIIPIAIVLGTVSGATWESAGSTSALHHTTT